MDRKLRSLTVVYSTNAANGPICAIFCTQISMDITATFLKLRASLVDEKGSKIIVSDIYFL